MQFVTRMKETRRRITHARRLEQIAKWLQSHYPAPSRNVQVYYVEEIVDAVPGETVEVDPHSYGSCQLTEDKEGKVGFEVQIAEQKDLGVEVDTLLHEWAHVLTHAFTTYHKSQHCDEYWLAFGRIYRAFHEGGGVDAARGL